MDRKIASGQMSVMLDLKVALLVAEREFET